MPLLGGGVEIRYCHPMWCGNTSVVGLPDGAKNEDMYNRLDTIPACDRWTDGRTSPQHSPHYAYASNGKNHLAPLYDDNDQMASIR